MSQLEESDRSLIKDAHGYVYHVLFKENMFHPSYDIAVFTFSQLITAFREGFDYWYSLEDKPKRLNLRKMEVLLFYRVGLPDFVSLDKVPEFVLLLDYPTPNV